ncbi:hypothetical protein Trydic_g7749 [Trypoxylus dichotomus]
MFMEEYHQLGHMSKLQSESYSNYLLHYGIFRADNLTTKLRVVFDGSAATSNGISFNDIQYTGPNIQQELISILIRFRQHNHKVAEDFRRSSPNNDVETYELNTVTHGTRSAPFLAIRCFKQLGKDNISKYPAASKIFDPLGLLPPIVTTIKLILQNLWSLKLAWDDPVPDYLKERWFQLRRDIQKLNNIQIPKHVFCKIPITIQLHGFCDAFNKAYKCYKHWVRSGSFGAKSHNDVT